MTDTVRRSKVERVKEESNYLRGTLAQELAQDTPNFGEGSIQLLKFHGVYQQTDRDQTKTRKQQGLEPAYSMMIRTKNTGGACSPEFYLAVDALADSLGSGTIRATTRQAFQLHGVLKQDLKTFMQRIHNSLGTTLAACGDVERNVMSPPLPFNRPEYRLVEHYAQAVSDALAPKTGAYYEIWLNDEKIHSYAAPVSDHEPLYGSTYLPRKFKTALTVPGDNSIDLWTNDLGFVLLTAEDGTPEGFDVTVGGGMGMTHNAEETFPRLADPLGFVPPEDLIAVAQAVVKVQRDYGDRLNRKHARLKYLIADRGIDWFRGKVEEYSGKTIQPWRGLPAWEYRDYLGWHEQGDGLWSLGVSIANGRIKDEGNFRLKSALREIVRRFHRALRITPQQNILLINIPPAERPTIDALLKEHGVRPVGEVSNAERYSMACPALPTCSLALTEAERYLPTLLAQIDQQLQQLGLGDEKIAIRMTGCPNGCARPYMGEIGLVGSAADSYHLMLGGNLESTRLNQIFKERVHRDALLQVLTPLFDHFRVERAPQEGFGDWCNRRGMDYLRSLTD
ncbi:NADPH-dependent assimilatory sulfite reductase hemoprotein subunit [Anthocerotibacter panamensis]|uniref:NADPH-dependent assimilatory sulfite reductase hemoprotein subunit n=1 Tax=Anthocerotibacter panamensis TaxID=2857077 RepID=UPI001C4083CC|nr:NADPH-dependent assimilatory sulfite reductase hemoprotein subunit [Anthocerotibacter panamensis]